MTHDSRVLQLLEKALDSNLTPDDVCAENPELLPEVRERWLKCMQVESQIAEIFSPTLTSGSGDWLARRTLVALPKIEGYEVEAIIGRGGMGLVYRARHLKLDRPVAVKMLLSGAYASRKEVVRFMREARAVAALRHPHVVQVHDVGELDGRPFFTMELIEGGSLAEQLAGVPQTAARAAGIMATLAGAVESAHQVGIVHRDLKPANILLTRDGSPKISDFGLARRVGDDDESDPLTLSGARVGTPSYMSPEQALGRKDAIGPAVDIYSLGAILYEMLTGRPPFRGESAAETERQLIEQDPVPPSRLNSRVPKDLETICLMCLHKSPQRRYASAGALAADLSRYAKGEPISARPVGRTERVVKWLRRHPAIAVAMASGLLVVAALLTGGLWIISNRQMTARAVEDDLQDVSLLQRQCAWTEADAAIDRAALRLGDGGPAALHARLDQARVNASIVKRLDVARIEHSVSSGGMIDSRKADAIYTAIFREGGVGTDDQPPAAVAARVRTSDVATALISALDDWTLCAQSQHRRDWLLDVAGSLSTNPATDWRIAARDPANYKDAKKRAHLVATAPIVDGSVPFLLAFGRQLKAEGQDQVPFLIDVQAAHPSDFWTNQALADAFKDSSDYPQALRFYQAAVALRPGIAVIHNNFGMALAQAKRFDEAIAQYRQALQIDPDATPSLNNLGVSLSGAGKHVEAIEQLRKAVVRTPNEPVLLAFLGNSLAATGQDAEAIEAYKKSVAARSNIISVWQSLRSVIARHGTPEEVRASWRQSIDACPNEHMAWDGYAEYCLFIGREDEYRRVRPLLLKRFAADRDPHVCERTGRASLLLPPTDDDELRQAAAAIDRALASEKKSSTWALRYYLFAKGLAEYRGGQFAEALEILEGDAAPILGPAPGFVAAMARHQMGDDAAANEALDKAIQLFESQIKLAGERELWLYQILRREAEALIRPKGKAAT